MICEEQEIRLRLDRSEKKSMLMIGGSRNGKSVLMSEIAEELIRQGNLVHVIDLGEKWTNLSKERLCSLGAARQQVESQGVRLIFGSINELIGCSKVIANAIGFQSVNAKIALKKVFQKLLNQKEKADFSMEDILIVLESDMEEDSGNEWIAKIYDRLDCLSESLPKIHFSINEKTDFSTSSTIWDLSGIDDEYVQIIADVIGYTLLCQQKRYFKTCMETKSVFLIIDEFQNLSCNRTSIIGKCLTEGQKYHLYMILATQFLNANFSEAVINQFKQGGFRFYFRLTEEEARLVSRQLAYDHEIREEIYKKLISLPVGNCLMKGPHSVGKRDEVVESFRFVKVLIDECDEEEEERRLENNAPKIKIYIGTEPYRKNLNISEECMLAQKGRRNEHERHTSMGETQHDSRRGRRVFRNRNQPNPRIDE